MCVRIAQDFRNHVDRQIERNLRDPRLAAVGLVERRRVAGLAEQQPHGRHRGRAGAQVQAQFGFGPVLPFADLGQLARRRSGRWRRSPWVVQLNRDQFRIHRQPIPIPACPNRAVVAQQTHFVERLRGQQRLGRAEVVRLRQEPADLRHDLFAFLRRERRRHRAKIAVANPLQQDFSFGHGRSWRSHGEREVSKRSCRARSCFSQMNPTRSFLRISAHHASTSCGGRSDFSRALMTTWLV